MSTSIHDDAETWGVAAATGGLTADEFRAWSDHIANCPACRKINDENFAMSTFLKKTLGPDSPDGGFEQRIIRRLHEARAAKAHRWSEFFVFHPAFAGVAAGLALLALAGVGLLVFLERPAPVPSIAAADSLAGLPAVVRAAIQRQAGGRVVSNVQKNENDAQVSYTVSTQAADASEWEFTVAEDGTLLSADTTLAATPAPVRNAITAQMGDGQLQGVEKNFEDGEPTYIATVVARDGQARDLAFNEDGTLFSREIAPGELPAPVKTAIDAQVGRGQLGDIDKTTDGGGTSYVVTIVPEKGQSRVFTFGEDARVVSREVTTLELPPAVKRALDAQLSPGRLSGLEQTFDRDGTAFRATFIGADGQPRDLAFSEEGKLLVTSAMTPTDLLEMGHHPARHHHRHHHHRRHHRAHHHPFPSANSQ